MSSGLYNMNAKEFDQTLKLDAIKPYGDTMNDGKLQISFTLPVPNNERGRIAAIELAKKMGLADPHVVCQQALDTAFTFYVVYGSVEHTVNYEKIQVREVTEKIMPMEECEDYIDLHINRPVVVVGACTGSDAHTVGIDAIMNMKGYAGVYGLERYRNIEAYNMGSQVPNEELIKRAKETHADAILVSQTVTQKDVHIHNLTELMELLEAEGLRHKLITIVGGARITDELAKELGFDAGFGPGKMADAVATFIVEEITRRCEENQ